MEKRKNIFSFYTGIAVRCLKISNLWNLFYSKKVLNLQKYSLSIKKKKTWALTIPASL